MRTITALQSSESAEQRIFFNIIVNDLNTPENLPIFRYFCHEEKMWMIPVSTLIVFLILCLIIDLHLRIGGAAALTVYDCRPLAWRRAPVPMAQFEAPFLVVHLRYCMLAR
jgi:hypothetical protein